MARINPELILPLKMDQDLKMALTRAWRDMANLVNNLFTVYHQATQPVIPDSTMSMWHDTANSRYYLVANFGQGVIKAVEVDGVEVLEGLDSAKPAASHSGKFFYATDTGKLYYDERT